MKRSKPSRLKMMYRVSIVFLLVLSIFIALNIANIFVVKSDSMLPTLNIGDLIIVEKAQPSQIEVGDIIVFQPNKPVVGDILAHRVVGISNSDDGSIQFSTKGDNNPQPDGEPISYRRIVGRVLLTIPYVGKATIMINNPILLPMILITIALFLWNANQKQPQTVKKREIVYVMNGGGVQSESSRRRQRPYQTFEQEELAVPIRAQAQKLTHQPPFHRSIKSNRALGKRVTKVMESVRPDAN